MHKHTLNLDFNSSNFWMLTVSVDTMVLTFFSVTSSHLRRPSCLMQISSHRAMTNCSCSIHLWMVLAISLHWSCSCSNSHWTDASESSLLVCVLTSDKYNIFWWQWSQNCYNERLYFIVLSYLIVQLKCFGA